MKKIIAAAFSTAPVHAGTLWNGLGFNGATLSSASIGQVGAVTLLQ